MNFNLMAKVYYTDGTTAETEFLTKNVDQHNTERFPAGFDQLGLGALEPLKTAYKYELWLTDEGSPDARRTEVIEYVLADADANDLFLFYQSSAGGHETIRCTGRTDYGIEVEKEEFNRILGWNYSNQSRGITTHPKGFTESVEVATGFMPKDELLPLIDLVASQNLFLLENGVKVPVYIPADSYSLVRTDDHLYGLNFTYYKAVRQNNYSNT